jgi:CBS domain-containing protein
MGRHRIGSLPVVDDGRLLGIVTEVDLLRLLARHSPPGAPDPAELLW